MAVEETFQIETPNEAAEKLVTVGMLHDFIVTERTRLGRPNIDRNIVYDLLRNVISFQLGVKAADVVFTPFRLIS